MSEETVEVVRRMYEAWERSDYDAALALFDEDVITQRFGVDPGTWHGHEGLVDLVSKWVGTFEEYVLRAEEFIDTGERVLVRVAQEGRGKGSGAPVEGVFWFVHGVRGRQIVRFDMCVTKAQALEAAGLSE
jgi:ketosteroid isomerase-like protein